VQCSEGKAFEKADRPACQCQSCVTRTCEVYQKGNVSDLSDIAERSNDGSVEYRPEEYGERSLWQWRIAGHNMGSKPTNFRVWMR
jgi:hypothetical protein